MYSTSGRRLIFPFPPVVLLPVYSCIVLFCNVMSCMMLTIPDERSKEIFQLTIARFLFTSFLCFRTHCQDYHLVLTKGSENTPEWKTGEPNTRVDHTQTGHLGQTGLVSFVDCHKRHCRNSHLKNKTNYMVEDERESLTQEPNVNVMLSPRCTLLSSAERKFR